MSPFSLHGRVIVLFTVVAALLSIEVSISELIAALIFGFNDMI